MPDISPFVEYGVIGVSIAIIVLFGYFMHQVFKFAGNHIKHLTQAIDKVQETLHELCILLKNQNGKK